MKINQTYTEKISLGEKIAMMLGGMGGVPLFAIISSFLTYFYTNTIGLNAGAVGMIILVSKVFDGASDLFLGNVIDKTRSKWGVCRPWVMKISVFGAIGILALFTVPDIGTTGQLIYVFLSYNISQTLIYTVMQLSLTSLPTYMTRDTVQQTGLFVWSSIGQSCAATMFMPMLGSAIEYGQWKTGVRSQAALMGANGAGQKIGQGLISAVLGGIMGMAGFNGLAMEQSAQAIGSVTGLYLYIPLVLTIIEIIIVLLYDLDKKYDSIMLDLKERIIDKE